MQPSKNIIIAILCSLTLLIAASIYFSFSPRQASLEKGSPEFVVQSYIKYLLDDNYQNAHDLLSEGSDCEFIDFISVISTHSDYLKQENVSHIETKVFGDTATVFIEISGVETSLPIGVTGYNREESFTLIKEKDQWRLLKFNYPNCG